MVVRGFLLIHKKKSLSLRLIERSAKVIDNIANPLGILTLQVQPTAILDPKLDIPLRLAWHVSVGSCFMQSASNVSITGTGYERVAQRFLRERPHNVVINSSSKNYNSN